MNSRVKFTLKALIFIAFFGLLAFYLYDNLNEFKELRLVEPGYLFPVVIFSIIHIGITGALNGVAIKHYGKNISHLDEFLLASTTRLANYVLPFRGGMAYRARYILKVAKLTLADFFIASSSILLITLALSAWSGLIGILIYNMMISKLVLFFLSISIGLTILILLPIKYLPDCSFTRVLNKILNSWHQMRTSLYFLKFTVIYVIFLIFVTASNYIFLFKILGYDLTYSAAIILTSVNNLAFVIQLTPAGFGIIEFSVFFVAQLAGINDFMAVAATLINRVITLLSSGVISLYGIPYLEKKIERHSKS